MSETVIKLVEKADTDKQRALEAAIGQIERAFAHTTSAPLPD